MASRGLGGGLKPERRLEGGLKDAALVITTVAVM